MSNRFLAAIAVGLLAGNLAADEIFLSPGEIENLGIRLVSPVVATEVAATEGTARVVIPPAGEAVVGTPQSGLLTGLNVAMGDEVVKGQVLAELRSPGFLALQREFLDALNTHRLSQNELRRDQQLHDEGIVSARRLQETTTRSTIAETSLNEHRQLLKIAGLADSDIRALETDQQLLESLQIRAPFDGVIVERMAITGQRLDAMSPLYRVADLSELWLEIAVQQEQVAAIRPGMTVTGPADAFRAEVSAVGRAVDPSTQSITVRARVRQGAEALRPGQFVAVQVVAATDDAAGENIWMVPASAVTRSGDTYILFVRTASGFIVRQVDLVSVSADRAYLDAKLDPGDRIAVSGISALKAMWSAQDEAES